MLQMYLFVLLSKQLKFFLNSVNYPNPEDAEVYCQFSESRHNKYSNAVSYCIQFITHIHHYHKRISVLFTLYFEYHIFLNDLSLGNPLLYICLVHTVSSINLSSCDIDKTNLYFPFPYCKTFLTRGNKGQIGRSLLHRIRVELLTSYVLKIFRTHWLDLKYLLVMSYL